MRTQQKTEIAIYFIILKPLKKPTEYVIDFLNAQCRSPFFSLKQKISRILFNAFISILPEKFEIALVSFLKKKASRHVYRSPATFSMSHCVREQHVTLVPRYPLDKNFYLGITFDIDYKTDYERLPPLLEDLVKNDIPATINLVTHTDYRISSSFIRDMQQSGFEIGLHGDTHNTALAFFPKPLIKTKLTRAINRLGFVPWGYRSPGLSYSRNLIEALDELGFLYDSSLTTGIAMYKSLEFPYVFQHEGLQLLEVPLFMQDYNYFVNDLFSEQETLDIFRRQIDGIAEIYGVAVINLHPIMTACRKTFWQGLLKLLLRYRETAYISTIHNLLQYRERQE